MYGHPNLKWNLIFSEVYHPSTLIWFIHAKVRTSLTPPEKDHSTTWATKGLMCGCCDNILDPRVARVVTTGEFRMKIRQIFPPKNLEQPEGWVTLYYTQPDGNSGQFFEEYAPLQYQ